MHPLGVEIKGENGLWKLSNVSLKTPSNGVGVMTLGGTLMGIERVLQTEPSINHTDKKRLYWLTLRNLTLVALPAILKRPSVSIQPSLSASTQSWITTATSLLLIFRCSSRDKPNNGLC